MKKKWIILVFIIIILVTLTGTQVILPRITENRIRNNILDSLDQVQQLQINVESFPALEILFSRLDKLEIKAVHLEKDQFVFADIMAEYRGVNVAEDNILKADSTSLKVEIEEKAINHYLKKTYPKLENFQLRLNPGEVYLEGKIELLENIVRVNLRGNFTIKDNTKIYFEPTNFQLNQLEIPGAVLREYAKNMGFVLDLEKLSLPLPIVIEEITIVEEKLLLRSGSYLRKAVNSDEA